MGKKIIFYLSLFGLVFGLRAPSSFSQIASKTATEVKPSAESAPDASEILSEQEGPGPDFAGKLRLDLTDCVRMAVRNNPEIRGADYDVEDSRYKLKEDQPRRIPILTYIR